MEYFTSSWQRFISTQKMMKALGYLEN